MRVTVAVTVTASGGLLPPMFMFKGSSKGRIVREFRTYDERGVYACQEKAWMDEKIMLRWVDTILKPYVETAPVGIRPILFLDLYCCHMMTSVVLAIQNWACTSSTFLVGAQACANLLMLGLASHWKIGL